MRRTGGAGTRVAVTGHRALEHPREVRDRLRAELRRLPRPLVGISALAAGADVLFARAVLEAGGRLEVVLASRDFAKSLPRSARGELRRLLTRARRVDVVGGGHPGAAAYSAAGTAMLARADLLIAVWDGGPSRGLGGTADLVAMARERGIRVRVIRGERARSTAEG
ncbi:MAG: hypothetical protein ABWY26_04290 [Microbacterium sp.]